MKTTIERMTRRQFARRSAAGFAGATLASMLDPASAAPALPGKETVMYKRADGVDIKADVFSDGSGEPRPCVVWIHGGGLINGHREQLSGPVRDFAVSNGFVLVSLDYRLAPESKLPAILGDIEDALRWLRGECGRRFGVNPERIAVAGGSAGGFLTLAAGFRVQPPPQVLLAFWGYGDLLGDWAAAPSPHTRHTQTKVSAAESATQSSGPAVADSRERKGDGRQIYLHGRQTGTWPMQVAGLDPKREPKKFKPFLPVQNVTGKFPPTVLVHGTADTDVPFEQSQLMVAEFRRHGVPFELHAVAGAEHGLAGADKAEVENVNRKAFEFVKRELLKP